MRSRQDPPSGAARVPCPPRRFLQRGDQRAGPLVESALEETAHLLVHAQQVGSAVIPEGDAAAAPAAGDPVRARGAAGVVLQELLKRGGDEAQVGGAGEGLLQAHRGDAGEVVAHGVELGHRDAGKDAPVRPQEQHAFPRAAYGHLPAVGAAAVAVDRQGDPPLVHAQRTERDDGHRQAVLDVLGRVGQAGLHELVLRERVLGDRFGLSRAGEVEHLDGACAELAQLGYGLAQHVPVACVQHHLHARDEPPVAAEPHRAAKVVVGPRNAAHPVVPALRPVVAQADLRMAAACREPVEKPLGEQGPVGHEDVDAHPALHDAVHDLQEVGADEGFAAGNRQAGDAARGHLVHDVQALLGRGLRQHGVRSAHVAVPAPIVAAPRDRPLDAFDAAVVEVPVLLLGLERQGFVEPLEDPGLLERLEMPLPHAHEHGASRHEAPVAELRRAEGLLRKAHHAERLAVEDGVGDIAPPTKLVPGLYADVAGIGHLSPRLRASG